MKTWFELSRFADRLEVALLFPVLHRGLGSLVISAGAPLRDPGDRDLRDDIVHAIRRRFDTAGADDIADRTHPHDEFLHFLTRLGWDQIIRRQPLSLAAHRF